MNAQEAKPPPPGAPDDFTCRYEKKYTDSARLSFYPFSQFRDIEIVSFRFQAESLPIKPGAVNKDSLIERAKLTSKDVNLLTDILYNNFYRKDSCCKQVSLCLFHPRNAILFFDEKHVLKEYILLCFQCHEEKKSSEEVAMGDACQDKIRKLRKMFVAKGIRFGTNTAIYQHPGETLLCCED